MPFDGLPSTLKAKQGDRVRIELLRPPTAVRRAVTMPRLRGHIEPSPIRQPARFSFHDIGTYYQVTASNESSYRETVTEMPVAWSATDKAILRNRFLANVETTTVGGSNRTIERCVRLQSDSTETDGCITALLLKDGGTSRRFDLIAATDTWCEAVPAALRLASIATLPAGPSSAAVSTISAGIAGESLESWDAYSRVRTGSDGTIVAHMLDGRYRVAVESSRNFYSFDTSDLVNFKITDAPAFERPEASTMSVEFGDLSATSVDVWLVPQMHQIRLDWQARYLFFSIYGVFSFVTYPSTTVYQSRLPFYPYRYSLSLVGTSTQAVSMSQQILRTEAYAALIAEDVGRQVITPFFVLLLDGRVEGTWRIFQREISVGQLVGVAKYRYQGGYPITRYIWRRTLDDRPLVELDSGSLNTQEVTGIAG